MIGQIGGHLGRRGDPPPGHLALCDGYRVLLILCEGLLLARLGEPGSQSLLCIKDRRSPEGKGIWYEARGDGSGERLGCDPMRREP